MSVVAIAELKAHLSEHLARVKAGEEVIITERGRPIARICELPPNEDQRRDGMIAAGKLRPAKLPWNPRILLEPTLPDPQGLLLQALLAEREEGW